MQRLVDTASGEQAWKRRISGTGTKVLAWLAKPVNACVVCGIAVFLTVLISVAVAKPAWALELPPDPPTPDKPTKPKLRWSPIIMVSIISGVAVGAAGYAVHVWRNKRR